MRRPPEAGGAGAVFVEDDMRNTTTTVVIAAGAVLAAVIVTRTPAQQEVEGSGACCLPNGFCFSAGSDASCQSVGGTWSPGILCDYVNCIQELPPTVVGITVNPDAQPRLYRAWSDGQVDVTHITYNTNCGSPVEACTVVVLPGTCPSDVNRDGDTGIQDFLALLGGWGECP